MQAVIEALPVGADSPLARLDGLHFSRLQIFRELVHQGRRAAQARPPAVEPARVHEHVRRRAGPVSGRRLRAAGRRGGRAGGSTAPAIRARPIRAAFKRYIRDHQVDTSLFASAHPNATRRARCARASSCASGSSSSPPTPRVSAPRTCRPASGSGSRADAARAAAEPPAPAVVGGTRRPGRHPGQRAARLLVPEGGVPVPADRRSRPGARADDAACCRRWRPPSRGPTGRRPRRCTWRSPPPGWRRSACRHAVLDSFPAEFREGMAARAERLGDRGPSAPEHWERRPRDRRGARARHDLRRRRRAARRGARRRSAASAPRGAVTVVHEQRAAALEGGRDHFGFFDGIAQPDVQGSGVAPRPGDGQPDGAGRWRAVRTGEFLHGYEDEDGRLPEAPAAPFDRNGTFMVYRKLAMDVAAFRRFVAEQGARYPGGPELLAAKIVGRWRDGTPLELSPDRPDAGGRVRPGPDQRLLVPRRRGGPALPGRRAHPPRQPARRRRLLRRPALQPPPDHPPRPHLRPAAARRRARGRRRRPRARVRLLQRQHLAPVRDDPGALDRRRRPVRARPRQGLPDRRAGRRRPAR